MFQIRPDIARAAESEEVIFAWILLLGGSVYMVGGALLGARRAGVPLKVKTTADARAVLQTHP